jgi:hypothetical protein
MKVWLKGLVVTASFIAVLVVTASFIAVTITHNLGTKNVLCTVYDGSDKEVICDILTGTTNSLTVTFAVAPVTASTWRVVVFG